MKNIIDNLNSVGKPVWIGLMVIGFIWFWPIGLAILAYLVWSGRLGARINWSPPWAKGFWTSGNAAFDEHRADVLTQLETEQRQFGEFIDRIAKAKDRAEFDQFIKEQRR